MGHDNAEESALSLISLLLVNYLIAFFLRETLCYRLIVQLPVAFVPIYCIFANSFCGNYFFMLKYVDISFHNYFTFM